MNKYLSRDEAPIGPETWSALDAAMTGAAKSVLAGRRLLAVEGPFGLGLKAIPLKDDKMEAGLAVSSVVPLAWLGTTFALGKRDLAAFERDAVSLDLGALAAAALEVARLEDTLVFRGTRGIAGLLNAKGANALSLSGWGEVGTAAANVIEAVTRLDASGFHGPYTLALAPNRYNLLLRRYPQGNGTELEHLAAIATAGVLKAPMLESGGILMASGPQFAAIVLGQDMTIGYVGPTDETLGFSVTESLALLIRQPKAICVLQDKPA